jgi:nucleoside-diphosphate-sugar epimerase
LSKIASEQLVNQYAAAGNQAVIVGPTRVYGPGPWNDANGTTRLMAMYLRGRFRLRIADGDVQANYVHVQDVAQGILLAAEKGRSGAAYQLGDQNATLPEFLQTISDLSGISRRVLKVPAQVVAPVAHLAAGFGRLGGCPSLTPEWLNNFLEHRPADISRSRLDLGYAPMGLRNGIAQTLPWLLPAEGGASHADQIHVRHREAWA